VTIPHAQRWGSSQPFCETEKLLDRPLSDRLSAFVIIRRARPLAALISAVDLERLERSAEITRRLAQALGQSPKLLAKIEAGKTYPTMAAFGLWQDEEDLEDLEPQILKNRQRGSSRPRANL